MTEAGPTSDEGSPSAVRAVLAAAAGLHVSLLAYFMPRDLPLSGAPFNTFDYALHAYQVDRAMRTFHETGRLWSYDPLVLAGQPAGAIEDLTSKTLELFVIALSRLGANPWMAFDAYVLLVHLAMPFVAWKAARLFDLNRLASAVSVLFWVVLWYFDSLLHWFWYIGMISWGAASYLVVLVVALMYRATERSRPVTYLALALTAALVTLLHPFAVLPLILPLSALYWRSFRKLQRWEHAAIAGGLVGAAATTLVWIGPALRFRHDIGTVDAFLWPSLSYVVFDWLDVMKDVLMTGQPVRTAFRFLAFGLALLGLLRLRRGGDRRALPLTLLSFGALALGYVGGYSTLLRQTQPYRQVGPATLAAALVAAMTIARLAQRRSHRVEGDERAALALALVLAGPVLGRTVVGFLPTLLPGNALSGTQPLELPPTVLGPAGPKPAYVEVGRYLGRTIGQTGRVVAFEWMLGEYLATFTRVPILGGFPQRNVPHIAAHPLKLDPRPEYVGDDPMRRYVEEYAVGAVVLIGPPSLWDFRPDLLGPAESVGDYRIYRVRRAPSYFERGEGRIVSQRLDSIRVADATGPEVVLRFHWLQTLRCRPNCTAERTDAHHDGSGFIRVPKPPPAFEIFNGPD